MRLSKQFIGIAVAVAFATGLATTETAFAVPSGTQIEYKGKSVTAGVDAWRTYVVAMLLSELFLETGL